MGNWDKYEEGGAIIKYIRGRYKKGILSVVLVFGAAGVGKSWLSMRLGEKLSEKIKCNFDSSNIVDNLRDVIGFVRNNSNSILIIEESSILFPSRRSMGNENVYFNKILDSCRKKRIILIMNYPVLNSIDSHILKMSCLSIEAKRIYVGDGVIKCRPLKLQTNFSSGKIYRHYLIDGVGDEVNQSYFRKPSDGLTKPYEKDKDKFLEDLYEDLESKHNKKLSSENKTEKLVLLNKSLTPQEQRTYNLHNQDLSILEISKQMGISRQRVSTILGQIRKKTDVKKGKIKDGGISK